MMTFAGNKLIQPCSMLRRKIARNIDVAALTMLFGGNHGVVGDNYPILCFV